MKGGFEREIPKLDVVGSNPIARSERNSFRRKLLRLPSDGRKCGPKPFKIR
jgi:hypothetical protein